MYKDSRLLILVCFTAAALLQCNNKMAVPVKASADTGLTKKGLKDYYKGYFPIGVSVTPRQLVSAEASLVTQHFNSLTAENAMKMGPIHPREAEYFWRDADSIAAFARRHGMKMRGHTLVWHTQTPAWLFTDSKGDTVTKEVLLQRMKDHISAVVGRYKNDVYAWDVVNEVMDDNDSVGWRNTAWYRICGEEFIAKAFEYAHAADPKAVLFYNDYNTESPGKRSRIYQMVKKLKEAGVPIHGVGLQGHWSVSHPTSEEIEKSIQMFSSLGLQVQVTELDVSVYTGRQGGQIIRGQRDTTAVFTPDMEQKQLEKYKMIFEVLRRYKKDVTGVTFWNVSDRYSWLDMRGRKNFPLLFDQKLQPKKAYWEVVNF